jgi:hypothetical protein
MYLNINQLKCLPIVDISVYLTKSRLEEIQGENSSDVMLHVGRPDIPGTSIMHSNWLTSSDIFDYVVQTYENMPTTVVVCGPKKMTKSCWDATNSKTLQGHTFHFHQETFEF